MYRILDPKSLVALVADLKDVRAVLGGRTEDWRVREVGDGNLNLVFIMEGPDGRSASSRLYPMSAPPGPRGRCRPNGHTSRIHTTLP
jgi:hypothetical protein